MEGKRILWLDFTRGIAMLFIIIGHCAGISESFKHLIFSFHIPLFFILSGFLYKKRENAIWRDFKQLIIPYIIVVFFVILFDSYANKRINLESIKPILKSALYGYGSSFKDIYLIGAIWFLPTMFFARRMMDFIFSFKLEEKVRFIYVVAMTILGVKIPAYTWVPMNIDIAFVAVGLMYVGYLLKHKDFQLKKEHLLGCFLIWFSTLNCGNLSLSRRGYDPWFLLLTCGVAGSIFIIGICMRVGNKNTKINHAVSFVGRHTLLLLCIHDLDWRLPINIWRGFLQQFEGSIWYFPCSVVCRMGFDILVMCGCILLKKGLDKVLEYKEK